MLRDLLRSRVLVAAIGGLAVLGLMVASVGLVQAGQDEQAEERAAKESEQGQYRAWIERAMAQAKEALEANHLQVARQLVEAKAVYEQARLQEVQDRLRLIQEDMPRRLRVRSPRVEILGDHLSFFGRGGSSADAILAQAEELELTDAQQESIRSAQKAARRAEIARNAEIEVAELDLDDLLEDEDSADLGAVEAKMREISNLRVSARIADLRLRQEVRGVLTDEQRDKFEEGHNVWMYRTSDGDNEFHFGGERDGMFFGPEGMLERFELSDDFPFHVFKWRSGDHLHEEEHEGEEHEHQGEEQEEGVSQRSTSAKSKGVKT